MAFGASQPQVKASRHPKALARHLPACARRAPCVTSSSLLRVQHRPDRAPLHPRGGLRTIAQGRRPLTQRLDGPLEVIKRIERAIHGSKTQVGDDIKFPQKGQNRLTDLVCGYVGDTGGPQLLFDLLGQDSKLIVRHGPALTGLLHTRNDLVARKRLDHTRALDDLERRRLERGESFLAVRALTDGAELTRHRPRCAYRRRANPGYDRRDSAPLNGTRSPLGLSQCPTRYRTGTTTRCPGWRAPLTSFMRSISATTSSSGLSVFTLCASDHTESPLTTAFVTVGPS